MRTKFYTKAGDKGETKIGKQTLPKNHALFEFLGACDQLNSWLGVIASELPKSRRTNHVSDTGAAIRTIQGMLFIAMAEAAGLYFKSGRNHAVIGPKHIDYLEQIIEKIDEKIPALRHFIVPGGTKTAARLDYARTIARTVERTAITMNSKKKLSPILLMFLNRLSSLLFAMARYENKRNSVKEQYPAY